MQELLEKYWKWAALGALTLLAGFLAVCAARGFLAAAAAAANFTTGLYAVFITLSLLYL